jgi:hypothetical protein
MSSMPWKEWTWPDNEPISSRKKQVHIDCELCSWHFSINSQMLSLKDLNKFKETAEKPVTCTFLWAVLKLLICLQGTATASSIPQAYADYADVFSESEAECLSAQKHDYVIDNNEKNPSHSPLYNLSDKKLQVQSYLNDVLVKGWIQHSVSSTGRQCYSPQRKTVACDCVSTTVS